jgi:hypothetical protein
MNSTTRKNAALPSRGIPHVIEIPKSSGSVVKRQEFVSKPSFDSSSNNNSNNMSPASEATKEDFEEMKRMVKLLKEMPASDVFAKFGLVDGCREGDNR